MVVQVRSRGGDLHQRARLEARAAGLGEKRTSNIPSHKYQKEAIKQQLIIRESRSMPDIIDHRLVLIEDTSPPWPTCNTGPVRIRAVPPEADASRSDSILFLSLDVTPEPHLKWEGASDVRIDRAVDEHGQVLRPLAEPINRIVGTGEDVMWVNGTGWRIAKRLNPGDRLHAVSGARVVDSISKMPSPPVVHNLVVEDFHTYFVGEQGILVHDITYRQPTRALVPGLVDDSTFLITSRDDR